MDPLSTTWALWESYACWRQVFRPQLKLGRWLPVQTLHHTEVRYPGVGAIETYCQSEDFLSVLQVSVLLDVSKQTVYRLINDGILVASRAGSGNGRLTVPHEEVDSYIQSLRRIAGAQ